MTPRQWTLAVCLSLASVFGKTGSMTTTETHEYTCKTFGSGVVKPFNGSHFYVSSNCPFIFTRFTHNQVECGITIRRGASGLVIHMEIIINKVKTVLHNGSIFVESNSVSLPYDHTYQHIFRYGIYTRLRSSLLPLSVTWHTVPGGIDTLWVELEHELSTDMAGLCGSGIAAGPNEQLISESTLIDDTCQIRDPIGKGNEVCEDFFSLMWECLRAQKMFYHTICDWNIHGFKESEHIGCAFYKEMANYCGNTSIVWSRWRSVTSCAEPTCPGDLVYKEQGSAFVPTCSNPNPRISDQDVTSSCVCPDGKVLNDHTDTYQCVEVSSCPCEFAGRTYLTEEIRKTKCQTCVCNGGKWICSENICPPKCLIEGQYVTTFDGKLYVVPGKCTYIASKGPNWMVKIEFSKKEASLNMVTLQLDQETFTFAHNTVKVGDQDITDLYQSDHALVFWQSSMYVQVQTSFGMKLQVQVFPEVQIYITPPKNYTAMISGLCGNNNGDTTDDFTTSSGIIENSAQAFALSWSVDICSVNIPPTCINTDNEMFADEKCAVLNDPTGIFAECHKCIPTDQYHTACIQRTCNCDGNPHQCMCVALSSYANACSRLGVHIGDWRKATNCTLPCQQNMEFSYQTSACNRTCRSLSAPDPCCELEDDPVEGCGCPEGTHLSQGHVCTRKAECVCHHHGGIIPPGPVVIDGRQCMCENGELHCSKDCGCTDGKVCFHCSEHPVNTALKTCDSLSKPLGVNVTCESGCYCSHGQFEDHRGNCVSRENCTCVFSGEIFGSGQEVKTNCKTCVCGEGQWHCKDEPCAGTCQVYGNGHYQTFDSKFYRFSGHCRYTLVEDYCGETSGTFSISVESVPCCDEAMTCSRSIILHLQDEVSLILSDMRVTKKVNKGWTLNPDPLYTIHTVGLYILISVPSRGLLLIWDKYTRITIELHSFWRNKVCGLCGNFDSNEMNDLHISSSAVASSPLVFGNSWKADTPPCSDVTTEIFPCEHRSYCSAWAQRRCLLLTGDTFRDCHLKVDPSPYYQACVQDSCSCQFEGKFLGFCTSVAAYATACSKQDVCINWRTPYLCPIYCDYYNEQGQCSWHYEACGKMMTCSKGNYLAHRLEGCYPRCPEEAPYYDENIDKCTPLRNCTCLFNDTVVQSEETVEIDSVECYCINGTIKCQPSPTTPPLTTASPPTAPLTTTTSPTTTPSTTATTERTVVSPNTTATMTTNATSTTTENWSTSVITVVPTTRCECKDLKRKKSWYCGETWTEDCFIKSCINTKIELTPVDCPITTTPTCPRNKATKVSDGCCETWKCDCQCDLYGDPHYISFQGVEFNFLDDCTYTLVEERVPRHNLTIAVDNFYCTPGINDSCAKGIILTYQNSVASLSIIPQEFVVQATLNNVIIEPPYEEHGFRFETTEYMVSLYLPEIRSYVSLTPFYTLVVNLGMEYFLNNTQGQCGVCGGPSCIRKGGQIEADDCCDKTSYDWVYPDHSKPACASAPRDVPCFPETTSTPNTTTTTTTCPPSPTCDLLWHPVFDECSRFVNLNLKKKNCDFDSCRSINLSCSSLEQAAAECKKAGFCIEWRALTNGICDVPCPVGLVYRDCSDNLDDFCYGGVVHKGASVEKKEGCFCPSGLWRAANHSHMCVDECPYCKGPRGEPKLPGEVWESNCMLCTCNNRTRREECVMKPPEPVPVCGPGAVLVNLTCCGEQICVEKNCTYDRKTYKVGDEWRDATRPCKSFSCSIDGIQTETKVCPNQSCPEARRVWDDEHCCFTCTDTCALKMSNISFTVDECTTVLEVPVCQGQCESQPRLVLFAELQVVQDSDCCQVTSSEIRSVTLHCLDRSTRLYTYRHLTNCECRACCSTFC